MSGPALIVPAELAAAAALYGAGVRLTGRWPRWRSASFAGGLALLGAALAVDPPTLVLHMAQHLVLALGAAPLLVLGSPLALALRATRRTRALRFAWAAAPAVGWVALALVMALGHLPAVLDGAEAHAVAHAGLHVAWLGAGVLFWRAVLGADPVPHRPGTIARLLYLLLFAAPMAATGAALQWSAARWYAGHALADQRASGVAMLVGGGLALAAWTVGIAWAAVLREHRRRLAVEELTAA
ncbi:MAG: cytochrome c oxidase assembly protein [Solirubrobacteraceae bacterium]